MLDLTCVTYGLPQRYKRQAGNDHRQHKAFQQTLDRSRNHAPESQNIDVIIFVGFVHRVQTQLCCLEQGASALTL